MKNIKTFETFGMRKRYTKMEMKKELEDLLNNEFSDKFNIYDFPIKSFTVYMNFNNKNHNDFSLTVHIHTFEDNASTKDWILLTALTFKKKGTWIGYPEVPSSEDEILNKYKEIRKETPSSSKQGWAVERVYLKISEMVVNYLDNIKLKKSKI